MSIILRTREFPTETAPASDTGRPVVGLDTLAAKRFLLSTPEDFFQQYGALFRIAALHRVPTAYDAALDFAKNHPEVELELDTLASVEDTVQFARKAEDLAIPLTLERRLAPRLLQSGSIHASGFLQASGTSWEEVFTQGGRPQLRPWADLLQEFLEKEVHSQLRLRKDAAFEAFLKALAKIVGTGVNWNALARDCGISQPRARLWGRFLSKHGVIDFIGVPTLTCRRRLVRRETVFWNAPGLALWLSGIDIAEDMDYLKRLQLNALYLHCKDETPAGRLLHYRDTNRVEIPLIREFSGGREALFFASDSGNCERILKRIRKVLRIDAATLFQPSKNGCAPSLSATPLSTETQEPRSSTSSLKSPEDDRTPTSVDEVCLDD